MSKENKCNEVELEKRVYDIFRKLVAGYNRHEILEYVDTKLYKHNKEY